MKAGGSTVRVKVSRLSIINIELLLVIYSGRSEIEPNKTETKLIYASIKVCFQLASFECALSTNRPIRPSPVAIN